MKRREFLIAGGATVASLSFANAEEVTDDKAAVNLITKHVEKLRPLEVAAGKAWWEANTTGSDDSFKKKEEAQNTIDAALADKAMFRAIEKLKKNGILKDSAIKRQIDLLYLAYLEKQLPADLMKQITSLANSVEKKFNVFRAKVDGHEMSDSDVRKLLKTSTNTEQRQKVWEASKEVGKSVEADLAQLVVARNAAATALGFKNYHQMMLTLNEQDGDTLIKLFDELDMLTRKPFEAAKAEIDAKLAERVGKKPADLMPWDYQDPFFQESQAVFAVDIDRTYRDVDILKLCKDFYQGVGLPIEDVIDRSDLYEKKGKSPHAFCTDIDRDGDVRVLANIVPNEYWMSTMLHELGHAVYSSKNIPKTQPYLLRSEAHILTTEGVAMQFQKFSKSRPWLEKMGVTVENGPAFDDAAAKMLRNELLIFSRWCQVMLRFEQGLYEKPGQDLNALWWSLVEKYQGLKKPVGRNAPDYGSKIHICSAPVYYHNYMMGQLFASQVHHALCKELYQGDTKAIYIGDKKVGQFMTEKVFAPGKSLPWNELTKHATGETLNAKAFAKDFQN